MIKLVVGALWSQSRRPERSDSLLGAVREAKKIHWTRIDDGTAGGAGELVDIAN